MHWSGSKESLNSKGVYGIVDGTTLIYIGSTKSFKNRLHTHNRCFEKPELQPTMKLYKYKPKYDSDLKMVPLIDLAEVEYTGAVASTVVRNRKYLEWALILIFKPECNTEGVTKPFSLRKDVKKTRSKKKIQKTAW